MTFIRRRSHGHCCSALTLVFSRIQLLNQKIMKTRIYIYSTVLAIGLFVTSACNNKLDVDPTDSIDESTALSTSKDVEVTLIGCYDALQDNDVYGGAFQYSSELLGNNDEIGFGGTFQNML